MCHLGFRIGEELGLGCDGGYFYGQRKNLDWVWKEIGVMQNYFGFKQNHHFTFLIKVQAYS